MRTLLAFALLTVSAQAAEIPLKSIYSTTPQEGMIPASHSMKGGKYVATFGRSLGQILAATKSGASNAFLVDATTIDDAMTASRSILLGSRAADTPPEAQTRTGSYWLVAYLGTAGSHPTRWAVESVKAEGNRVRVSYQIAKPQPATMDARPYYLWIPLGTLDDGAYRLELFDGEDVTLMRRVEVKAD